MDKSYVTMAVCPICQEDNGTILMDRRLKDTFERRTVDPTGVCDKCRDKYLTEGILLINPKNGNLVVLKEEAFKAVLDAKVPENRIAFCDQELLDKIQAEANSNEDA